GAPLVPVPAALDADVLHRSRPCAPVLHSAVFDARLRQLHPRRCDPGEPARDLERAPLSGLPQRFAERPACAGFRRLRSGLEPLTMGRKRIALVIPTLNEAEAIGGVLAAVPRDIDEIIVADSSSTDRTAEIAAQAGARVVNLRERGYGRACRAGAEAAGNCD